MTQESTALALAAAAQEVQDSDAANMTLGTALMNFWTVWPNPNQKDQ